MKRYCFLIIALFYLASATFAQGLRHSVCVVKPELSDDDKTFMADYALYIARAGLASASRTITNYKTGESFGSGVVVEQNGKKYVLTNLHVVGYAEHATLIFQLHEKTLRYPHCAVVNIGETDLAAIELPAESDLIALPVYSGSIEEDVPIVAAGFPELANKPSWQLTRGIISNAHVDIDNHERATRIIQHTASIDPGSSGGPLLLKNEAGKYEILGINTWKAFYREGVGLAIGKEDVTAFMASLGTPSKPLKHELQPLRSVSGEDWLYIYRQLPDTLRTRIKETNWHMPFDQALLTLTMRDSLVVANNGKGAKHYEKSSTHVVTNMESDNHFRIVYDNYFGKNQQVGIQFGHDWSGYVTTGLVVTAYLLDPPVGSSKPLYPGIMFGLYLGGQVPIAVGQYILAPTITQSAQAGPLITGSFGGSYAITTDTRIGLNWYIPVGSYHFVAGLHYDMNWLWSESSLNMTPNATTSIRSTTLNQFLQHGIGVNIGVAW